jgi:hypothetical protein
MSKSVNALGEGAEAFYLHVISPKIVTKIL